MRLLCSWNSPGQNTRVGNHSLLQGIFLTQNWKPGLPHCRKIVCHLSHYGSPESFSWTDANSIWLSWFEFFTPLPGGASSKGHTYQSMIHKRGRFELLVGKIPWRNKWQPTPVLPEKNPMDRGNWQVTVHGVAKSQTRLKQCSTHIFSNLRSSYLGLF